MRLDLHTKFEVALWGHSGEVLSREDIKKIIQSEFPEVPDGSVVPTDHAEPSAQHVNQCRKCAEEAHRIFDTVSDGQGKPNGGRYRVRAFQQLSKPTFRG